MSSKKTWSLPSSWISTFSSLSSMRMVEPALDLRVIFVLSSLSSISSRCP